MNRKFFNLQRFAKKISLTSGADNYENKTANRIIYALGGKDTVENYASKVTISGGNGNDSIVSYGQSYHGQGNNVSIAGGAGADSLYNYGNKVKMFGGAGKDYIYNYEAETVTIDGGAADDQIKTWYTDHVTITGGKGNDSIQLGSFMYYGAGTAKNTVIKYASGDGNDTIYGFDSNDTLHITSGNYSTSIKGDDFIVTVGKQKITLKDAVAGDEQKVIIKNSSGELDIYNDWKTKTSISKGSYSANNVTLKAAKSVSEITNYGDNVRIVGNNGVDGILNGGNNVTISGGKGNDVINSGGDYCSISGGAGNDKIGESGIGNYVTVNGGKGNDYISMIDAYDGSMVMTHSSYKDVVQYANGDGKDTIRGFNSDDTLKITSGTYSASVNSNSNNVIIKVGKGSITLLDARGQDIYITDANGKTTKHYFPTLDSSANISELLTENDFATANNLSAIVENNLSAVSEIQTNNFETLTQENLITYAEK